MLVLIAFKLALPRHFFLSRGNHEAKRAVFGACPSKVPALFFLFFWFVVFGLLVFLALAAMVCFFGSSGIWAFEGFGSEGVKSLVLITFVSCCAPEHGIVYMSERSPRQKCVF